MANNAEQEFITASESANKGLVGEFAAFLGENKKWWMIPFLVAFGLLGVLMLVAGTGAAPFVYSFF